MRRLLSLTAFGFGFYYLWNNTDPTTEMVAVGAMGFALLLEFIGADRSIPLSAPRFVRALRASQ